MVLKYSVMMCQAGKALWLQLVQYSQSRSAAMSYDELVMLPMGVEQCRLQTANARCEAAGKQERTALDLMLCDWAVS